MKSKYRKLVNAVFKGKAVQVLGDEEFVVESFRTSFNRELKNLQRAGILTNKKLSTSYNNKTNIYLLTLIEIPDPFEFEVISDEEIQPVQSNKD